MKKYTSYTEKCKEFQKEMLDFFTIGVFLYHAFLH